MRLFSLIEKVCCYNSTICLFDTKNLHSAACGTIRARKMIFQPIDTILPIFYESDLRFHVKQEQCLLCRVKVESESE